MKVFLEEFIKAEDWSQKNIDKLAELETGEVGIDVPTLKTIHSKAVYGLLPITDQVVNKQQQIADLWYAQGLLPKKVNVKDGVLTPKEYALRGITPELMQAQQSVADLFYNEKILPKKIDVKEALLTPQEYAAITPEMLISGK